MATDDEFWLLLHDVASAVNTDGAPWKDKAETLSGYLKMYPPVAKQQLIEEFRLVLGVLTELEPAVLAERKT